MVGELGPEESDGLLDFDDLEAAQVTLERALEATVDCLRTSADGMRRARLVRLCALVPELQALHLEVRDQHLGERLRALVNVQEALSRLRGIGSLAHMQHKATSELCRSCGFDRAILFRVENSEMVAESVHFEGHPEWAAEILELAQSSRPQLNHLLLETEMLRRRAPVLVDDAQGDPRTFKPIVQAVRTTSYVAAPVMPESRVIGFLHADCYFSGRSVDTLDRDTLWAFAEGFGYAVERTILLERLRSQRDEIRRMMGATESVMNELCDAEVELGGTERESAAVTRTAAAVLVPPSAHAKTVLTPREREVLALMGAGLGNAEIANRLVISEQTVKSHVKHILRKLPAANRAEAVSKYMRMSHANGPLR